ncbi:MAG: response regulator [Bacteroidetes bacterium]|nr:response regulator [Bacteroidota bacterium]
MKERTILIIEDDTAICGILHTIFTLHGFNVHTANKGENGLRLAATTSPNIILCDIMLPDIDGYAVLSGIKQQANTAQIPFIFLSAYADPQDIEKGLSYGADAYVTKPFGAKDIIMQVNLQLNKNRPELQATA